MTLPLAARSLVFSYTTPFTLSSSSAVKANDMPVMSPRSIAASSSSAVAVSAKVQRIFRPRWSSSRVNVPLPIRQRPRIIWLLWKAVSTTSERLSRSCVMLSGSIISYTSRSLDQGVRLTLLTPNTTA